MSENCLFFVTIFGAFWTPQIRRPLVGHQAEENIFATCTLDILEIPQIPNITIWLLCRHVYCNLQAGYTVTLIFGVLQPSGLVACSPPGIAPLPPSDLGLRILGGPWKSSIFDSVFYIIFQQFWGAIWTCILLKNLKNKGSRAASRKFTKMVRKKCDLGVL